MAGARADLTLRPLAPEDAAALRPILAIPQVARGWDEPEDDFARSTTTPSPPATQVVCVDRRRQWSRWRNVWHSAAIRSTLHAPARLVRRRAA